MKNKIIIALLLIFSMTLFIGCKTYFSQGLSEEPSNESLEETLEKEEPEVPKVPEKIIEYVDKAPSEVRIPILMYHSISDENPNNALMVPPKMFDEQMAWLKENDFTPLTLDEAVNAFETGHVPKRPVIITFDDGYADNYIHAFPSLKNHEMKATFFVITDLTDNNPHYMSSDMLKEMQASGMVIENHTSNHIELNRQNKAQALKSIKDAQTYLREVIGAKADYLCYPVGKYTPETIEICKELGIKAAVTTKGGKATTAHGNYELRRVRISPMSKEGFAGLFSEYLK
ncbi:MAG: polysaccharide deacetylase family protein [Clostridium sp.]